MATFDPLTKALEVVNVDETGFTVEGRYWVVKFYTSGAQHCATQYVPQAPADMQIAYTAVGTEGPPPTPPPSVSLSGSYELGFGESGTWTADVTDGVAPFTYRWRTRPSSSFNWTTQRTTTTSNLSDSYARAMSSSGFVVEARVTDDRGESDTRTVNVAYDSGGGPCPPGEECVNLRRENPGPRIALPDTTALNGSYPNPARETATIRVALPEAQNVTLTVYDMQGRVIERLANGTRPFCSKRTKTGGLQRERTNVRTKARGW